MWANRDSAIFNSSMFTHQKKKLREFNNTETYFFFFPMCDCSWEKKKEFKEEVPKKILESLRMREENRRKRAVKRD